MSCSGEGKETIRKLIIAGIAGVIATTIIVVLVIIILVIVLVMIADDAW